MKLNNRIFSAAMIVGSLNAVVMAIILLRDQAFAYRFGTGEITDAFLIGLLVPAMAIQLIAVSLSIALVPAIIQAQNRSDRAGVIELASGATAIGLALLSITTIVLFVAREPLLRILTSGFDETRASLVSYFYIGFLPSVVIQGWSTLIGSLLNASRRFAVAALAPVLRPLTICLVLVVDWQSDYPRAILIGYLGATAIEAIWVTIAAARASVFVRPKWRGGTPDLRRVLREFAMVVLGTGILSGAILADQYFASLLGAGGVSSYSYGSKITSALLSAGALPLGVAVLPHFSEIVGKMDWRQLQSTLWQWTVIVLFCSVPVVVVLRFYSADLVQLLFQRGAFSAEDTKSVALVQNQLALQVPFYLCGILYVRTLLSMQKSGLVAIVALSNAIVNVVGSLLLLDSYGISGIALSATCGYIAATAISGVFSVYLIRKALRQQSTTVLL